MTYAILLDILAVGILLFCVIKGAKRGLISSLLYLGGYIASILISWWLSKRIATYIYKNYLDALITESVENKIRDFVSSSGINKLPDFLHSLLGDRVQRAAELSEQSISEMSRSVVDGSIASSVTLVLRVLICIVLFLIVKLIIKLIARALRGVNNVPVLGSINRLGGAAAGLVEGAVICYLVVLLIAFIITVTGDNLDALNKNVLSQTVIFSWLYELNPLKTIIDSGLPALFKK